MSIREQGGTATVGTADGPAPGAAPWRGSGAALEPAPARAETGGLAPPADRAPRPDGRREAARPRSGHRASSPEAERRARIVSRERVVLGGALLASVGIHMAIFAWSPDFQGANLETSSTALQTIQLPPDVKIPPPPQAIARPATPKVAATNVSPELTIAPTDFESNPTSSLAPPPPSVTSRPSDRPTFIPYDVPPKLLNRDEIERLVVKNYPKELRSVGIGGAVVVWAYVDAQGGVVKALVKDSSGYPNMDQAALKVVEAMRFKPALNRDTPIAVWISQKVSMTVRR